ncbi:hypothetical protein X743_09005 [Mesorhizobium sp. LNHC252B00]|nr:hypothetical protein [Mesorhizobium sp. LNHC252B00]ESY74068.1 hypothetical protein X743_09005 [Mesorhizobium sp. LNHC252B00]
MGDAFEAEFAHCRRDVSPAGIPLGFIGGSLDGAIRTRAEL